MIEVVNAKKEDYDNFLDVFKELEEYHRLKAPWKFKKPEGELFPKDYFQELIYNKDALFILAKSNNETIGFLVAFKEKSSNRSMLQPRRWIHIDDLSIKNNYKKKGIGTLLMSKAEEFARKNKINEIELNVWCFNGGAIKFYEKKKKVS